MMPASSHRLLLHAAERAQSRPEYLGWVFARFEQLEDSDKEGLQKHLRVAAMDWPRLQLCLRPRADHFLQDVTQIAQAFGIDRAALAAVIRRVEAVEATQNREQSGSAGSLLAARTRKRKQPPSQPEASSDE